MGSQRLRRASKQWPRAWLGQVARCARRGTSDAYVHESGTSARWVDACTWPSRELALGVLRGTRRLKGRTERVGTLRASSLMVRSPRVAFSVAQAAGSIVRQRWHGRKGRIYTPGQPEEMTLPLSMTAPSLKHLEAASTHRESQNWALFMVLVVVDELP